ncbi:hypothetical protein GJ689_23280 [Rhodoplanes serenus]|uniref:Uncharacterized protein n=1 Tax=Rhodoplanes serenus TaxID=200615 RepID=A0A9X5AU62_9BRAD|nr:hypothetical protein [Rhodoplanes serenus]MTW19126.1 hypothetical protein [Rhodoplanes serenus]
MSRPGLAEQLLAVTLAHAAERAQLRQAERAGTISGPERELKARQVAALRGARETLVRLLRQEALGTTAPAVGAARLFHDAMVAAHGAPDLSDPTGDQECEIP